LNTSGNLRVRREEVVLECEADPEDSSDGSSVVAPPVVVDEEGESDGEDGSKFGQEGEGDYEDPDEYGERLVDDEGVDDKVGESRVDRVSDLRQITCSGHTISACRDQQPSLLTPFSCLQVHHWLMRQVDTGAASGNGEESRKRKRPADQDEPNQRSRPRPRLQTTHGISELQKIRQVPSTYRKSIGQVCELYDLDSEQLMHEISRNAYLMNLPVYVDEHTNIDTWDALRTHLHSTACRPGAKMQRMRAKPATGSHGAKNDPVLYVDPGQETPQTAKLNGKY
jgi:hypothetical protein